MVQVGLPLGAPVLDIQHDLIYTMQKNILRLKTVAVPRFFYYAYKIRPPLDWAR